MNLRWTQIKLIETANIFVNRLRFMVQVTWICVGNQTQIYKRILFGFCEKINNYCPFMMAEGISGQSPMERIYDPEKYSTRVMFDIPKPFGAGFAVSWPTNTEPARFPVMIAEYTKSVAMHTQTPSSLNASLQHKYTYYSFIFYRKQTSKCIGHISQPIHTDLTIQLLLFLLHKLSVYILPAYSICFSYMCKSSYCDDEDLVFSYLLCECIDLMNTHAYQTQWLCDCWMFKLLFCDIVKCSSVERTEHLCEALWSVSICYLLSGNANV